VIGKRVIEPGLDDPITAVGRRRPLRRGEEVSYDELMEMASGVDAGSDGLTFYPYMLGERRRGNTTSRGGYFGITLNHAAPHFVRAIM